MTEEHPLSDREIEVLQYVAAGLTNREIAQKLSISHNTVKVHLSNIFEKIGVASRTEATVYAIEHRIVDVPGGENVENNPRSEWLHFFRRFAWVWIGVGLLLLALLVKFTIDTFFPSPTPTALPTADIAERWKELAPMPEARQGMAAVAFDGNIYTLAGEGPKGVSGSVFRYLPEEDRWETLSDKPTPVTDVEGVVIGEKIYIPGGETVNGKPTDILEIYDPRQDTWETGAPLPQPLSAYALADFEGKMYLFGGWDGEEPQDSVYIFDPSINSWCEGVPMLHKAYNVMAAVSDGKIFVVGGTDGETHFNIANAYLPNRDNSEENPWVTVSNIPYFLCQSIFGMEEMGDLIILIAPTDKHTYIFMFYYPQQDQWIISSEIKSELFPLYSSSVSIQGYLYLFGGVDADGTISYAVSRYQGLFITAFPNVSQ
jgi:DNA-binding CsgD family transcriptional regulator/N-acetylneuraminic acid mutarotase